MREFNLAPKFKLSAEEFTRKLKGIYKEDLVSVILYGSAATGEFVAGHSDINLLVILKNAGLTNLIKADSLINAPKFRMIHPLFFSMEFFDSSLDVFPVEFLGIKENYIIVSGIDILKDISVDIRNLRFQCEHELKSKLINLKQSFIKLNKNKTALEDILFKTFISAIHILRNIIRIKGKQPFYLKQDIVKQAAQDLPLHMDIWLKILSAKNRQIKLSDKEVKELFIEFTGDLENIISAVDKL